MTLLGIFLLQLFALATPGPDSLLVLRTALAKHKNAAFKASLGISLGAFIWVILSLLGLHVLFQYYPFLNKVVLFCGACYLLYLAYQLYHLNTDHKLEDKRNLKSSDLLNGLLCNLSNPKAIIYFASIFSMLSFEGGIVAYGKIILLIVGETLLWFLGISIVFSHPAMKRVYQSYARKIDVAAAGIFVLFACLMFVKFFLI
ncbi:LysE family transporter [Commensalibacter oyaizuii]|uniref:LysE family transporter n=1 Tax=Commensalibacter oyaizuii TaxID=3043873 RepID=A0ABT6PY45_9PROT|nr:LysE family transporter [Commensalibacter sp. TBRC 16381]MDI2089775.1 LysE family transporter [Commensalibacter sp. TBRC 16381]